MTDTVTSTLDGQVAVVTVDDGKANALSHDVIAAVHDALGEARTTAGAVALVGRPGRFSAGFDLTVMRGPVDGARDLLKAGAELAIEIYEYPLPVVIGATGHSLAMGAILLLAADTRIGAEGDFKIGMPEVAIGMPLPRFAVELARDRLSRRWFTSASAHAEVFDPAGAVAAGYLDRLVPADDVIAATTEHAAHLASTLRRGAFVATRANARGELAARLRHDLATDVAEFVVELPSD
ncbi:MAG: crotonase/enoyl-CoA hydratase family protein [Acidimicrobiales bacterium]|jgi:enoyl-CoA hydratase|nr:crotonase/enoyl-CoA hydratase family protein [Acidimicrobiales bacterium]